MKRCRTFERNDNSNNSRQENIIDLKFFSNRGVGGKTNGGRVKSFEKEIVPRCWRGEKVGVGRRDWFDRSALSINRIKFKRDEKSGRVHPVGGYFLR